MKGAPDRFLPEVSTCTLSIRLPHYSQPHILRDKLLMAMAQCTTFDTLKQPFPAPPLPQKQRLQSMKQHTQHRVDCLFADSH